MSKIANRKLKMADTFTREFPLYEHGEPSLMSSFGNFPIKRKTMGHTIHQYEDWNYDTKKPTHFINREYTHKKDPEKVYQESLLKLTGFFEKKITARPR